MAFIPPTAGTTVVLYSGIPADPSYENVLMFSNEAAQRAFFESKTPVATFTDFSYIDGTQEIRVPANRESLYNVNYIAYRNTNYGSKWFYAFVTRLEYYSANSTAIFFEADEWATWQFSLSYHKSFIEREHINDDAIGNNLTPENIELGERVPSDTSTLVLPTLHWYLWVSERIQIAGVNWLDATELDGTYLTGAYYTDLSTGAGGAAAQLSMICNAYATDGKLDEVLTVFSAPMASNYEWGAPSRPTTLNGYIPRNNKMFTFPYCYLDVFVPGNSLVYKYEYFQDANDVRIGQYSPPLPNAPSFVWPKHYANMANNYEQGASFGGYPIGAANVNSFTNYMAQNTLGLSISTAGAVADLATNLFKGKDTKGMTADAEQIGQAVSEVYQQWLTPRSVKGTASAGNALAHLTSLIPQFISYTVNGEFAAIADNYFSMYGYKTLLLKLPNVTGRANWNFVKTINANITGNCPVTSLNTIKSAFNNGITLWHNGTFDYGNMSNPII